MKLLMFISLITIVNGQSYLRYNRILEEKVENKIQCTYTQNNPGVCVCPGSCMTNENNSTFCVLKKCYNWNTDLGKCEESGANFVGPLVLQAIPFTGVFGSGFGNIGRWDLFGLYMGILFGGCFLVICLSGLLLCVCPSGDDDGTQKESCIACSTQCSGCIWGVTVLVMYILGIVWMATPGDMLDGNGCLLSGF